MTMQNPVALAANTLRQVGETGNQALMSLGTQFAQVNSQLLRGLATGAPPLPLGLPGLPGLPGGAGNPNGGGAGLLPTPANLIPRPAIQAIAQLENSVLPPGAPRPAQLLLQSLRPDQTATGNGDREPVAEDPSRRAIPARSNGVIERSGY